METLKMQGGCFCGSVRFTVTDKPRAVCICHCTSCRRASGGGMVPWATFALAAFQVESGSLTLCETSPGVIRGHCARCGTSISYRHATRPDEVDLTLSSLEPHDLVPTCHIWTDDKPAWSIIGDDLPRFPHTQTTG
jgi:hypothetical protein